MITLLTVFFINASSTPGPTGPNGANGNNMGGMGPTGPTAAPGATGATGQTGSFSLQGGKTITLTSINFSGNKDITSAQLQSIAAPFLNRSFSETDLYELKQRVVLLYQSKGYQNVQVTIPAKQNGSTLTIVIVEGKKS